MMIQKLEGFTGNYSALFLLIGCTNTYKKLQLLQVESYYIRVTLLCKDKMGCEIITLFCYPLEKCDGNGEGLLKLSFKFVRK